ncbi:unnamed protein product [Malus baccata var. baccata]
MKKMVVPDAINELGFVINCQIRVLRLQKGHKYSLLGQLLSEVGWNHYDTIKRKEIAELAYERKKLGCRLKNLQRRSLVPSFNSFIR